MAIRHVALVCAALMFTGCSDAEPVPKFDAEPEPSVEAAPEPKRETARQFIKRWAELERDMQNSGDSTAYREAFPDCRYCLAFADQVDEIYANGGYIKTDGITVGKVTRKGDTYDTEVTGAPTEYRNTADSAVEHLSGGGGTFMFVMQRQSGHWALRDVQQHAS